MSWFERYQRRRREALAEYGIGVDTPQPWPDDPRAQPQWDDDPVPRPPDDAGAAARIAELEAQLAGRQDELREAREVHTEDNRLIAELRKMVDQYEAHTAELEALAEQVQAERDQLVDVLKIPGMKTLLSKQYSPDTRGTTEAEKRALTECVQKINAAYDLIKHDDRAKKSDEAA